ncbi:unnamed protein product [Brassica oleracea]
MSLSCCWNRSKQKSGENKTLSTFGLMDPPTSPAAQNPSSLHSDSIISSLLSFPASAPFSIACSFDRELEKALASASGDASVQDRLLNRTIQLASLLLDSTERCFRKRASAHNSVAWVLPPELTVKVFSKLDTKSLMQAATCCTVFNKCAMDRSSYAHIDLTTATKQADNEVVCTMIHRAGKELRSLKLGHVTRRYGPDPAPTSIWFNGPFLSSLAYNNGFLGNRLRSLRLYNIRWMTCSSSFEVFSFCSNLTDLRIVGSNCPFRQLFMTLTKKCRLIEHLCLGTYFPLVGTMDASTVSHLIELVTKSPNLTSLTLIGFQLTNDMARNLVESCRKLKYLNFSRSPKINGHFLRDLGNSCKESPLETLIMRNCVKLEEVNVFELLHQVLLDRSLHSLTLILRLYNVGPMHYSSVLSVCSNLTDLRIVGSNSPHMNLFMTLSKKCRLIEHLCLVSHHPLGDIDASTASHLIELVTKSPNLTSLTLLCFQLTNEIVRSLVESCRKLKYLNLSRSPKIDGCFLRDLGNSCKESPLETLIMRNCVKLEEKEVLELCNSLLKGNFKFIRHIDVSSNNGLVSDDGRRSYKPKFPVEKLKEERPDVTLVADFPLERSGKRYHVGVEGDDEELKEIEMMDAKNDEENDDDDDSFEDDDDDDDV